MFTYKGKSKKLPLPFTDKFFAKRKVTFFEVGEVHPLPKKTKNKQVPRKGANVSFFVQIDGPPSPLWQKRFTYLAGLPILSLRAKLEK